ncbi:hypothetical protein SAMN05421812_107233 [Asanoa hainanensis]|uniref:Uncharacterized protein n=1 Tax=Asanoa hainanensis TaxID=560556 RepID=A0A239N3N8_9ACTN|nr:hypothetical protein SAMN05421812_107233 [Asanoa hainanensis]
MTSSTRRRNLLDLTSQEWSRPERRRRSRKAWLVAVGGLALSGLGFALLLAARADPEGFRSDAGR